MFERRNNLLDVRRSLTTPLDVRPERDWRRHDERTVQANRVEVIVGPPVEQLWPVTLGGGVHLMRLNAKY